MTARQDFSRLWVPSESKVWDLGTWIGEDLTTNQVTVEIYDDKTNSSKQITISKSITHPLDDSHLMDLNDLCLMNNLHEAPLLHVLKQRLVTKSIYTFSGDVLISLNPYQVVDGLYDSPLSYLKVKEDRSNMPHVYLIADKALQCVMERHGDAINETGRAVLVNQSVIVSGESGAGKTEASKHVMNFLIAANESIILKSNGAMNTSGERIKNVLLQSSIVLEAFGNSKTVRNDNSSRFGKYIKLMYTADNELVSAFTETFLLEKSRLVYVGQDERNYHIFYQLLRGLSSTNADLLSELKLISVDSFKMLTEGKCTVVTSESDDNRDFVALDYALNVLGFSTEEKGQLWKVLACILHLGNITFTPAASDTDYPILNSPIMNIEEIATILGLPQGILGNKVCSKSTQAAKRVSFTIKILTAEESQNNVSALLKWLYKCVFAWLVQKINNAHASIDSSRVSVKFIGILDIFGFEILRTNSFEQLCINYTNERLQQQFNERIFVSEQEEYKSEGLNWNTISFKDNQHVIDLISKKPQGLLMILEEHGMLNRKPDDVALLKSFNQAHDGSHPAYIKSRFGNDGFVIKHFAGDVTYSIDGFLIKNNDSLQDDLSSLLSVSTDSFVQTLLRLVPSTVEATSSKKMAASVTVSYQFRNQLDNLTTTLRSTDPHYIKCIKPNSIKAPFTFDPVMVNEQLRYSGALEVVRIRREGFPSRMKINKFYSDYEILGRAKGWKSASRCTEAELREYTIKLLEEALTPDLYQIGHTILFLRSSVIHKMQKLVLEYVNSKIVIVQSTYRRHNCRDKFRQKRLNLINLQKNIRMIVKRKIYVRLRDEERARVKARAEALAALQLKSCIMIQSHARKFIAVKRYRLLKSCIKIQSHIRKYICHRKYRVTISCIRIQSLIRKYIYFRRYARTRNHVIKLESVWRGYASKKHYKKCVTSLVRTQTYTRMVIARLKYLRLQKKVCLTQSVIRQHQSQRKYLHTRSCIVKLQGRMRKFIKKLKFPRSVDMYFNTIMSGEVAQIQQLSAVYPHYSKMLWKKRNYCSVYEAALQNTEANAVKILTFFDVHYWDVVTPNLDGNNLLHVSIERLNYAALLYLCTKLDDYTNLRSMRVGSSRKSLEKTDDEDTRNDDVRENNTTGNTAEEDNFDIIKAGWLKKSRSGSYWNTRYCVLTEQSLLYYKAFTTDIDNATPEFEISIEETTVNSVPGNIPKFEITSPSLVKKTFFGGLKKGSMLFVAKTDKELQEWLLHLKAWSGVDTFRKASTIKFINYNFRAFLCNQRNKQGCTPLHILAQTAKSKELNFEESKRREVIIQILSWILDYDCPIDAKNTASDTALSIALKENNHELVELLLQRNANYEVTNSTEALLSLNIPSIASQLKRTNTIAEYNHIIPLKRFPGKRYCYLSWNIKSQVALKDKFKSIPNACMTISVYNTRKQVIETSYVIESPKYHDETHILWSSMWHMQTPLENIEPGSFILLEVKSNDMKESKLFGYYPIDKDTINSCEYTLDVYNSTVNLDNIVAHKPPDKSLVEYALQLDFLILRENRIEPIEKLMCEYDATSSMSSKRKSRQVSKRKV